MRTAFAGSFGYGFIYSPTSPSQRPQPHENARSEEPIVLRPARFSGAAPSRPTLSEPAVELRKAG